MNKKIVLAVLSLGDGGAERVVSVWANELNARGYDVSILVFKRCRDEYRIAEGIAIEAVAQDEKEYLAMSFTQRLKKVRAILRRIRPDYVIPFLFTAQIWMLNDTHHNAQVSVDVSLRLGNEIHPMFTWNSGMADANKIGPSVNFVLPDADATEMTLVLKAGDETSEYRLCYRSREERRISRQLNV